MKKGFTLIEITIVIAILGILLSISYMNFTKISVKSNVDSKADEIASMLKDTYENGNKEMNFKDYYIEILKNGNNYEVSLINHGNPVRKTDLKDFELIIEGQAFDSSPKYIYFSPKGKAFLSSEKIEEDYDYNIDDKKISNIIIKKTENISKKIHIDDMPPGNITVD